MLCQHLLLLLPVLERCPLLRLQAAAMQQGCRSLA
jgi:hypothetical protein